MVTAHFEDETGSFLIYGQAEKRHPYDIASELRIGLILVTGAGARG